MPPARKRVPYLCPPFTSRPPRVSRTAEALCSFLTTMKTPEGLKQVRTRINWCFGKITDYTEEWLTGERVRSRRSARRRCLMEEHKHISLLKEDYFLLTVLLTPSVGHFHTRESSSSLRTPAGGPPIQFTSERAPSGRRPSREGPSPQDHPHLTTNHRPGPKSPARLSNLLHMEGAPANSGNMRLTGCSARGEQPVGKRSARRVWVSRAGTSVSMELGCSPLPTVGSLIQMLSEPSF